MVQPNQMCSFVCEGTGSDVDLFEAVLGRTTYEKINSIQAYIRVQDKDSYFPQMNDLNVYCV